MAGAVVVITTLALEQVERVVAVLEAHKMLLVKMVFRVLLI